MHIEKFIDYNNYQVFKKLTRWDNDPEIKHLIRPRMSEKELDILTVEVEMESAKANATKHIYLLYDVYKLIGSYSIDTDFEHRINKKDVTAWIGLVIGDKDYRGKGLGKIMMQDIEKECVKLGCDFIELGVFDFNKHAASLYHKMGYEIIGVIPDFVYHDGKWCDDIRMLKKL
ncbi:MAG: GNAT family N-acetyltransferase [Acidaminobacteraceae bacterium]